MSEVGTAFACFGGTCTLLVDGPSPSGSSAADAVADARRTLLSWHERFSRFIPDSELSRLNADPRPAVEASPLMGRLVEAVADAGRRTGGLVDGTLLHDVEAAGYRADTGRPLPLRLALGLVRHRRPARPSAAEGWRDVSFDAAGGIVRRPPGIAIDSGGLGKGLFADVLAEELAGHAGFAVVCAGDLRVGGCAGLVRPVHVDSPFDRRILHTFELADGGVATSGIGRRSWLDARGRPAHHLIDPSTGRPAFTGLVQVTALAPSALEAEIRAKAAILSGPERASEWLPDGGVVVADEGGVEVLAPSSALARA